MDSNLILAIAAVLTSWIMLSIIGSERNRKVIEFEANRPPVPPPEQAPKKTETK